MLLFPAKTKYRKHQKGKSHLKGIESSYVLPKKGFFGLKLLETVRVRSNQIEAARKAISKRVKRKYKQRPLCSVFSDRIATRKSSGIRMGKGKGNLDYWYTPVRKGRILFELRLKVPRVIAFKALRAASKKFSSRCKVLSKYNQI
jgi:large subunit ribosomal protein L16